MKTFLTLFAILASHCAVAQVQEQKDEYSHRFIYARPGDSTLRVLTFHRYRDTAGTESYTYAFPLFRTEPYTAGTAGRRLADEIPFYDALLRAAMDAVSLDSMTYLAIGSPFAWADVLQNQVRVFTTHPSWAARPRGAAGQMRRYDTTYRLMHTQGVYAAVDAWLARYGYRIAEVTGEKMSLLSAADLKEMGFPGMAPGTIVPVPNMVHIRLEKLER